MTRRKLAPAALAVCAVLAMPALAQGATRSGSAADASGDAEPVYDILKTTATYSTKGKATVEISLGAPLGPAALVAGVVGAGPASRDCLAGSALVLGYLSSSGKALAAIGDRDLDAHARVTGTTVRIWTNARELKRKNYDCATSAAGPEEAELAADELDRPVRLKDKR